jgi:hypothetical protein
VTDTATVEHALTSDRGNVTTAVDGVSPASTDDSNLSAGIHAAIDQLDGQAEPKTAVLLSDGNQTSGDALAAAKAADDAGLAVHTIGFGDANHSLLYEVAATTNGTYYPVLSEGNIPVFISRTDANFNSSMLIDADDDKLADDWEDEGFKLKDGSTVFTDSTTADTDGDGIIDGGEISLHTINNSGGTARLFFRKDSNPTNPDSDSDGLSDLIEVRDTRTSPLNNDSDDDGVPDGDEDYDGDGLAAIDEVSLGTSLTWHCLVEWS